jgi:FMN-dependent NADH-azoreductase
MPRLLHIQTSPTMGMSLTRRLSTTFVETWVSSHPTFEVDTLDLVTDPLPHLGPDLLGSFMTPPDQRTDAMAAAAAISDRLIEQLKAADVLVIGSPMINFTICSQLKSWFDHVTVPGKTFESLAPGQARGILFGKRAFVIEARGGDYSEAPVNAFDYQEPVTRMLLLFLGIWDISFIRAEGVRQRMDQAGDIVSAAEAIIARLAA